MAGMFYSLQEAAEKLNISEDQLKELAQEGKLREFRDGPNLLFKVDEVEALIPGFETAEPETLEPEMTELEPELEEEEPVELDLSDTEVPEAEEPELEMAEPEPQAEQEEAIELDLSDTEAPEKEIPEPEAEKSEPAVPEEELPDVEALDEDMPGLEVSEEAPSPEALEEEMAGLEEPMAEEPQPEEQKPETPEAEVPQPEVPEASETSSDSEILLAPETGAPLMSSDLTDADTALTGLGTSVLGETDQDYEITDDTMAETAIPTGPTGTTPEVPLEEIESDVNLDTFGSGSGLLDLSLQADDTSLGGILDEIYTAEDEGKEMGGPVSDSGAAMPAEADQFVPEEGPVSAPMVPETGSLARPAIELAPDAQSNTLGMLLFLPLVIVIYTTVVTVSGQRGVMPSILASIQTFIWYIMGGAAVVAALVVAGAFLFTGERGTATPKEKKAKKEKKPKAKKEKKLKKEKKPKEPKKPKVKKPKKS